MQLLCTQLAHEGIFMVDSLDKSPHYTGFSLCLKLYLKDI